MPMLELYVRFIQTKVFGYTVAVLGLITRFRRFLINLCAAFGWQTIEKPISSIPVDRFASSVSGHAACGLWHSSIVHRMRLKRQTSKKNFDSAALLYFRQTFRAVVAYF